MSLDTVRVLVGASMAATVGGLGVKLEPFGVREIRSGSTLFAEAVARGRICHRHGKSLREQTLSAATVPDDTGTQC